MFKKSRRRIVATIMSILVLLWVGTLGVIYISSYMEMKQQNGQMLRTHAQMHTLTQDFAPMTPPGRPIPGAEHGIKPDFDPDSPKFRLSTFYSVAFSHTGEVLQIKNEPPTIYADDDLVAMAAAITAQGEDTGTRDNLTFLKTDKGDYVLVVFMDNTVVNANAMLLFRYTLLFGGVALVLFFFLSRFLARKIVDPLEESYQKQKQFISDAGHELKTPVSVVSANAELLSRELGENRWLQNIQYENERMGMLVGQLLDLARTESVKPQPECLDFSRLVAGEALPFESVAFERGLTLSTHIAGGISVDGSAAQLKQLTAILVDNAIRHSNDRGEVQLVLTGSHSEAVLCVINSGDEIPAEHRKRIFERFYRMDAARNGDDKHYGLGLSIAKAIVDAHHGHIQVLCREGLIEFRVTLPRSREK